MTGLLAVTSVLDVGVISVIAAAIVGGYPGWRLLRANRRKIIAETANAATQALERALEHYEEDNNWLREQVRSQAAEIATCMSRINDLERRDATREQALADLLTERDLLRARLAGLDSRISALITERDLLRGRVAELERRLADAGITDSP